MVGRATVRAALASVTPGMIVGVSAIGSVLVATSREVGPLTKCLLVIGNLCKASLAAPIDGAWSTFS